MRRLQHAFAAYEMTYTGGLLASVFAFLCSLHTIWKAEISRADEIRLKHHDKAWVVVRSQRGKNPSTLILKQDVNMLPQGGTESKRLTQNFSDSTIRETCAYRAQDQ